MEISDQLRCLFSAEVEAQNGSYVVEIPKHELRLGNLRENQTYRVALLASIADSDAERTEPEQTAAHEGGTPEPPVTEGETRTVEIEELGEQGDGITRVERGYVVIVPDTAEGDRVTIEITEVRQSVAFAEVIE